MNCSRRCPSCRRPSASRRPCSPTPAASGAPEPGGAGPALSSTLVGNSTAIRSSVGSGLVWDSILGPLRVDYAYPLTKADYDVTQRLHFGYGLF